MAFFSYALRSDMSRNLIIAGLVIGGIFPLLFCLLGGLSLLMPGCAPGGSGGPAFGCHVLGISFNWLINFVTPAFVLSFFTVPVGLLLCLIGGFWPNKKRGSPSFETSDVYSAVDEALVNFRAGRNVLSRCPSCHSPVSIAPDKVQLKSGSTHVRVACECHACDGAYEILKHPG